MSNRFMFISTIILLFNLLSCSPNTQADSKSSVEENTWETVKINRFDKDFHLYLTDSIGNSVLKKNYKDFLSAFGVVTISMSNVEDKKFFPTLRQYFSNDILTKIYSDALKVFYNVDFLEKELTSADSIIFGLLKQKRLPAIGMHVSGFKENTIVLENYISISSDKYLGYNYRIYADFFPEYQRYHMQPKFMSRDILRAWLISERKTPPTKRKLLDEMIDEGKILYTLSVLLPQWESNDIIGYTVEQEDWSKNNLKESWKTILKKNYLFTNDFSIVDRFMLDSPSTNLVSVNAPGRLGAWFGWQIVNQYVENENVSLFDLLNTDVDIIWNKAKFNPR